MKKIAFLVTAPDEQHEGLRSSLGLLAENYDVIMIVLDFEVTMTAEYRESLDWFLDLEGKIYSNHPSNIMNHGFHSLNMEEFCELLKKIDHLVAF